MALRPTLTKITLTYEVEGQTFTKEVDPTQSIALFWADHSVLNLLASFYRPDHPSHYKHPTLTEAAILQMWNTPTASGHLPVVMDKQPGCGSGGI